MLSKYTDRRKDILFSIRQIGNVFMTCHGIIKKNWSEILLKMQKILREILSQSRYKRFNCLITLRYMNDQAIVILSCQFTRRL